MQIKTELSGTTIGLDNSITESIETGRFGIRIIALDCDHKSRFEAILSMDETHELICNLQKSLNAFESVKDFCKK